MLEVVDRPAPDRVIAAPGFGRSAQCYRNLEANGVAYVTVRGLRARRAVATLLNQEDSQRHLIDYGARHPSAWRHVRGAMAIARGKANPDMPIVVLDRAERRQP